jgi:hypothetical protein
MNQKLIVLVEGEGANKVLVAGKFGNEKKRSQLPPPNAGRFLLDETKGFVMKYLMLSENSN